MNPLKLLFITIIVAFLGSSCSKQEQSAPKESAATKRPNIIFMMADDHDPNDKNSLADNRVRAIHQSQDGLLWIGSFEGLNSIEPHSKEFTRFSPSSLGGTLPGRTIMDITPDPTDTNYLWISLSDSGVARLDLNTKIFDSYKLPPESKGRNTVLNPIHDLC